jgi:hypothetical protein
MLRIYDYLFFKCYQLGVRSKNFEDIPVLGGMMYVLPCVMFNIFALSFLLDGLGLPFVYVKKEYKFPFSLGLVLLLLFYYSYKGRYKKIINRYEQKERTRGTGIHPVPVIILYYITSAVLMFLAGLYKHGAWIFAK